MHIISKTNSIYKLLEFPIFYELLETILGANTVNKRFVKEFVCPSENSRILDIGCAAAKILEYLPKGVDYYGFDINPRNIGTARKRYKGRGTFFCSRVNDASTLPLAGGFDIVLASHVLHHLNDDEAEELFAIAYSHLTVGSALVTIDPTIVPNQSPIAKSLIALDRGEYVRTPNNYMKLIEKRFERIDAICISDMFRFPYNHFIMRGAK